MNTEHSQHHISWLARIFTWCAGCDIDTLKTCNKAVISKQASLGFIVLIPAGLALAAGTAFILTITKNIETALGIGILWAIAIFFFDRHLLKTTEKSEKIWKNLFSLSAIIRIVLAGVLGYIVSQPLVLELFDGTLQESLAFEQKRKIETVTLEYDQKIERLNNEISGLNKENIQLRADFETSLGGESEKVKSLRANIKRLQGLLATAHDELSDEISGKGSSRTGKRGDGPVAAQIREKIKSIKKELAKVHGQLNEELAIAKKQQKLKTDTFVQERQQIERLRQNNSDRANEKLDEIKHLKAEKAETIHTLENKLASDFLTLINQLDALAQQHPNVRLWERLMTLLLFSIDMFAILLKLLSKKDEYEYKIQLQADIAHADHFLQRDAYNSTSEARFKGQEEKFIFDIEMSKVQQVSSYNAQLLQQINQSFAKHHAEQSKFFSTAKKVEKSVLPDMDMKAVSQQIDEIMEDFLDVSSRSMKEVFEAAKK